MALNSKTQQILNGSWKTGKNVPIQLSVEHLTELMKKKIFTFSVYALLFPFGHFSSSESSAMRKLKWIVFPYFGQVFNKQPYGNIFAYFSATIKIALSRHPLRYGFVPWDPGLQYKLNNWKNNKAKSWIKFFSFTIGKKEQDISLWQEILRDNKTLLVMELFSSVLLFVSEHIEHKFDI